MDNNVFKLEGSATGGLHASSMGADYPWSVQPCVLVVAVVEPVTTMTPVTSTIFGWQALNALTGWHGHKRSTWTRANLDLVNQKGHILPDVRR